MNTKQPQPVAKTSAQDMWLLSYWNMGIRDRILWWIQSMLYVSVFQVAIIHLVWGVCLINDYSETSWVMAVRNMVRIWAGGSQDILGWQLIAAGCLSMMVILNRRLKKYSFIILIPQQILVITAIMAAYGSIRSGEFANSEGVPRTFIFSNQWPVIQMLCLHTLSYCADSFFGLKLMVRDLYAGYKRKDRINAV